MNLQQREEEELATLEDWIDKIDQLRELNYDLTARLGQLFLEGLNR